MTIEEMALRILCGMGLTDMDLAEDLSDKDLDEIIDSCVVLAKKLKDRVRDVGY